MKTATVPETRRHHGALVRPANELAWPVPKQHTVNLAWLLAGCVLVTAPLFYCALFRFIESDHDLHVRLLQRGLESRGLAGSLSIPRNGVCAGRLQP